MAGLQDQLVNALALYRKQRLKKQRPSSIARLPPRHSGSGPWTQMSPKTLFFRIHTPNVVISGPIPAGLSR